jgi:Flp pilus assembly protein TadG
MTSLSFRARELWIDTKAMAAVEFAMLMPFMLVLYVGGVELSSGMAINVKVTEATHSVADMVSQYTQISAAQMQTVLSASAAIMAPYPVVDSSGNSLITITVSEVSTDSGGNATVQWSRSYNGTTFGTGRSVNQVISLPSSLTGTANNNVSFILGEASYAYTPNAGYTITGTVNLRDSYYLFPRCSTNNSSFPYYDVKYTPSTTCTCIQHLQLKTC